LVPDQPGGSRHRAFGAGHIAKPVLPPRDKTRQVKLLRQGMREAAGA